MVFPVVLKARIELLCSKRDVRDESWYVSVHLSYRWGPKPPSPVYYLMRAQTPTSTTPIFHHRFCRVLELSQSSHNRLTLNMLDLPVKLIFGGGNLGARFENISFTEEMFNECIAILKKYGVKEIDSGAYYTGSEKAIGEAGLGKDFLIDTKPPANPGALARDPLIKGCEESLNTLKMDQVETYCFHAPDALTQLEESLEVVNELYLQGKFKKFGLSNFSAADVKKAWEIADSRGWVKPTVYQGNYNAVARHAEKDLLPYLKSKGISFYAYSPIAGGFLAKSAAQIGAGAGGRWDPSSLTGSAYNTMYNKPTLRDALTEWEDISNQTGIPKAALAYRWVAFHSELSKGPGNGIIVGATQPSQLRNTFEQLQQGPLPEEAIERIEKIWDKVKDEAPINNFESFFKGVIEEAMKKQEA
ncbi:NADP-dependent oxidoreductase domain-containing protein [Lineolata rhizophorae]|uniref:NADP-dependent oxidoreductase domain-containing protein n=1 Tax=Lineolata rhizophorae TaxID=578093 RepID=A0A6A6P3K6_9PEZI|nr:NADP-dependent oxidoreductase domain-containing protein [Lineolata rhizophorae]